MKFKRIKSWTKEMDDRLRDLYPDTYNRELERIFNVSNSAIKNRAVKLQLKKAPGHGNIGFFKKNHTPWNKGMKGIKTGGITKYKPGHIPHNTKEDGAISLRKDKSGRQYKYVRIANNKWKLLHVHIWEQVNGKIPAGFIVIFKDKNSMNCEIENLQMITRADHARRNHNPEKAGRTLRKIWDIEKTRKNYGLWAKTGLGRLINKN